MAEDVVQLGRFGVARVRLASVVIGSVDGRVQNPLPRHAYLVSLIRHVPWLAGSPQFEGHFSPFRVKKQPFVLSDRLVAGRANGCCLISLIVNPEAHGIVSAMGNGEQGLHMIDKTFQF